VPVLRAAAAVEDVSLQGVRGGGELLAALKSAAGTLRTLNTSDMMSRVQSEETCSSA
jgi:hypothetical protein